MEHGLGLGPWALWAVRGRGHLPEPQRKGHLCGPRPGRARPRLCVAGRGSPFSTATPPLGGAWRCDSELGQVSASPEGFRAVLGSRARKKGVCAADCSGAPPKFVVSQLGI